MNWLGFALVTFGTAVAGMGWLYDHHVITGIGLALIATLSVLAALKPSWIAYDGVIPLTNEKTRVHAIEVLVVIGLLLFGLGAFHVSLPHPESFWPRSTGIIAAGLWVIAATAFYVLWDHPRARAMRSAAGKRRRGSRAATM